MNTINPVRPYVNLKNNPQEPVLQPQAPVFKGVIGQKVVQDITAKNAVTVAGILAMVGGMIGLSKEKVSDVMEELVGKIHSLMGEKAELESQNLELKKTLVNTKSEKEIAMKNFEAEKQQMQAGITHALVEKDLEIKEKDAKIAELQKYEAMAKVKSIEEIDTVMPEQFIATLQEIEEHNEAAHKSLFEYVMTGKGQEEFLNQMERNNILLKGKKDEIDKIPEVNESLKKIQESVGLANLGYDSYLVAILMLRNVLKVQPKASYMLSPAIYKQMKANAEALLNPLMDKQYTYSDTIDKAMENALDYRKSISDAMQLATSKIGEYVSETIVENSPTKSYRTFKNSEGNFVDYSLDSLYCRYWGESRIRTPEGEILQDNSRFSR